MFGLFAVYPVDFIFTTDEYKKTGQVKYQRMPLILQNGEYNELETRVLEVARYLNNDRESEQRKTEKIKKFNQEGFFKIENDEKLNGQKIEFIIDNSGELFGGINKYKGKLFWSNIDKMPMAMKSRCSRRGYRINGNAEIYVKFTGKDGR